MSSRRINFILALLLLAGLLLRFWHIDFGLPQSWYADEPEIGEPAIKYTYEIRNILRNNDVYKLAPQNYVYGTFPVYFYSLLLMAFSKFLNLAHISFSKMDLYVFLRAANAVIDWAIIPVSFLFLTKLKLISSKAGLILAAGLTALNWKLIAHAHYLNHDILITFFLLLANYFFCSYLLTRGPLKKSTNDTKKTILFALFFGLAVSTKVTCLLTLPIYIAIFILNKDYKNAVATAFIIFATFVLTNPFSLVFADDFIGRLQEMRVKEAGMVFDSVNYSPFKYLTALSFMLTLPVLCLSLIGLIKSLGKPEREQKMLALTLAAQMVTYILFFSLQSRRVDRWLLPIIPYFLLFAATGFEKMRELVVLKSGVYRHFFTFLILLILGFYSYYTYSLVTQFQRQTPKSASYIWARDNLPPASTKFGVTEEGLDPLNKLPYSTIWQFNSYEAKKAETVFPPDPAAFDYVITSSRPLFWTQKPEVAKKYPEYSLKWAQFTQTLSDTRSFEQIKIFETTQPNLIPLSEVRVYKKL